LSAAKSNSAVRKSDRAPFWDRFAAWWNGYELVPKARKATVLSTHDVRYERPTLAWETERLRVVQELWGEGFADPGGAEHILNMAKFFGLDPSMSVLDLGAGLGGASRAMSEKFGVWVSGLEANEELAEAGMAMSVMAGMGKKAAISHFDPDTFEYKAKSIDCVFSKEFFFKIADKPAFLHTLESVMKPRGQLLFTDYVVASSAEKTVAYEKWLEFEPDPPHIWSIQDYREALATLHLDIRVAEDITDQFHATVTQSWARYIKELQSRGVAPETTEVLVQEVELWARRVQAIEAGNLQVYRIHALKMDTDRLMSSW
jgi:cyclopropane fatty-acyl-phospholipid synthase-like methyltransferase